MIIVIVQDCFYIVTSFWKTMTYKTSFFLIRNPVTAFNSVSAYVNIFSWNQNHCTMGENNWNWNWNFKN